MAPQGGNTGRETLVYERQTPCTRLRVIDKGPWRYLVFDDDSGDPRLTRTEYVYQSRIRRDNPVNTWDSHTLAFQIPFALNPFITTILVIGLGGGTIINQYLHLYQETRVYVAEIDPDVPVVAREYFALHDDPRLTVAIADGRQYLENNDRLYDLICIDAFGARTIPAHLFTAEYVHLANTRLGENGMVAVNINGALSGPRARLQESITATFAKAFPQVTLYPSMPRAEDRYQMMLLLAQKGPETFSREQVMEQADFLCEEWGIPGRLVEQIASQRDPAISGMPVLTDEDITADGQLSLYVD